MKKLFLPSILALLFLGMYSCQTDQIAPLAESSETQMSALYRANATVPFHGEYYIEVGDEEFIYPDLITPLSGVGKARHLGKSTWESTSIIQNFDFERPFPFDPPFDQVGDMTFTAADGSQLFGNYQGTFDGLGGLGDFEITSGNGRFLGASSMDCDDCTYFWIANPEGGLNYLEFNGTLTNP